MVRALERTEAAALGEVGPGRIHAEEHAHPPPGVRRAHAEELVAKLPVPAAEDGVERVVGFVEPDEDVLGALAVDGPVSRASPMTLPFGGSNRKAAVAREGLRKWDAQHLALTALLADRALRLPCVRQTLTARPFGSAESKFEFAW